jgi:hypothetical protein
LTDPQRAVYKSDARFRALVAGRRFGKTHLSLRELLRATAGRPGAEAYYVAPTYRMAKAIAWRPLKELVRGLTVGRPNESELAVELRGGGRITLRGAENYDSLRGPGLDLVVLDEFADIALEAWTEVLRASLSDRQGRALFIGTPKGRNHFYDLVKDAKDREGWAAYQFTTLQGGNVAAAEVEAARAELDEKTFRQEYEASFESLFEGAAYYAFGDENVREVGFDRRHGIAWALDFNVNPMSSVLAQIIGGEVRVLEEVILPDSNTFEAVASFLDRAERYRTEAQGDRWGVVPLSVTVYGDASGEQRNSAADRTDWQIVREAFKRNADRFKVNYRIPASNPSIKGRIAAVNAKLKAADGTRTLWVDPRCKELRADFERVAWKRDANGNTFPVLDKTDPKRTHVSDALGYLVDREFGLREKGGARSAFIGV